MKPERAAEPAEAASPSSEAPALSREHLKKELEALHGGQHRTLRSAIFARLSDAGDDGTTVDAKVRGDARTFRIVAASGELALRRELAREQVEATAYLVPFARSLPRDIEAVLAGGRLWLPQIEWLLPRRFGAKAGARRLFGSKLRVVAQRDGTRIYARGEAPSIDVDDAWIVFLRDRLGREVLDTEAQLFAATLLDRERRSKTLATLLAQVKGAREELIQVLERRMGPSAPRVLAAWLDDASVELAAMAVAGEATRAVLIEGRGTRFALLMTVIEMRVLQTPGHPLRALRDAEGVTGLAKALLELGHLVPLVWQALSDAANEPLRRAILGEVDKLLGPEHVRPLALGSNRLPFVFDHRRKAFIEAIESAAQATDSAPLGRAIRAVDEAATPLLAHDAARGDERLEEQVEMASRLAAFLGEPEAQRASQGASGAPHAEIIGLATFQTTTGGWVDWARQIARVDGSGPFGKGLLPLVDRVDQVRDALDTRFARAYAQLVGNKGDRGVLRGTALLDGLRAELVLIEDALAKMGLELLEKAREMRLLILCMDGMSTANLAELWSSNARLSLVPVSAGRRSPVLANVPTITRLSRSALFAGRSAGKGESLDTSRDGDRLSQHPAIKRMGEIPKVLLKREIVGAGGGLSDDAAQAVRGPDRIVAVVVNAIDDQLKGSAQLRVTLSTENIRPLDALLEAAESTGRLVLLVSDHGNISSQRFVGAAVRSTGKEIEGAERGARHRTLGASETVVEDEIELPAGALAKGEARLAIAVHETLRYTSPLHAGEHGGASLAEAIAPAVLLAPRGLLSELLAFGVEEMPVEPPSFWSRDRAAAIEPEAPSPAPIPIPQRPATDAPQQKRAGQTVLSFEPSSDTGIAAAVFKSRLFVTQLREIAESEHALTKKAIELLVGHGGSMTRDRFAVALGIDTAGKGVRVPGFLSRLERVLNVNQENVISTDRKGQSIVLDLHVLRGIFLEDAGG